MEKKRKHMPKWKAGFNVQYSADEHCIANSGKINKANKCELSIRGAVLFNAIGDLDLGEGALFVEAWKWFNEEIESMPGYSFRDICDIFSISTEAARSAIFSRARSGIQARPYIKRVR